MTSERRPKLSPAEAGVIARDLKKHTKVKDVTQRFAPRGYPVIVVRAKNGRYFSVATDGEYQEILRVLGNI